MSMPVILWNRGDREVVWEFGAARVVKVLDEPPNSVIAWSDPPSVIIVESVTPDMPSTRNAVVFEPNGSERLRLIPPNVGGEASWAIGFYVVFADKAGLVAVFSTRVGDFWGRPDLGTGELSGVSQWR
ncbi:hypothetical protein ACI2K4_36285 [Micromonospora sp. NPDC050397]|uniref:hypothetical protein n=1 Tax=Micromonospora sp. NPDC050397 TaxID=3364279 RepID=UPI00384B753D